MSSQKPALDLSGLAVGSLEVIPADSLGSATSGQGMAELGAFCGCGGCACGGCGCGGCGYLPDE